jgi:hypothetical protein
VEEGARAKRGMNVVNVVCHAEAAQRHLMGKKKIAERGEHGWPQHRPVDLNRATTQTLIHPSCIFLNPTIFFLSLSLSFPYHAFLKTQPK